MGVSMGNPNELGRTAGHPRVHSEGNERSGTINRYEKGPEQAAVANEGDTQQHHREDAASVR